MNREYLGDGAYVEYDGFALVLTTEDGRVGVTNRIVLEPEVYECLRRYVETLQTENVRRKESVR